jgi:hypothetical protein
MNGAREVYDGLQHVGTIRPGSRQPWRAISADGRPLGEHQFEWNAMSALLATRSKEGGVAEVLSRSRRRAQL